MKRVLGVVAYVVALIFGTAALLLTAAPAGAHSTLIASDPAAESVLEVAPTSISLTFSQDVATSFATLSLVGPDGGQWAQSTTVDGPIVSASVLAGTPAGVYTIGYRVTSADGHPITGSSTFTVTAAAAAAVVPVAPVSGAPVEQVASDSNGNTLLIVTLVGALVILGGIGLTSTLRGSRRV